MTSCTVMISDEKIRTAVTSLLSLYGISSENGGILITDSSDARDDGYSGMILLSHKGKISAEGKNVKVLGVPFEYTELISAISEFGYFGEFKEAVSGAATQNGNDSSYEIRDNTVKYNGREAHLTDREMMLFEYLLKKHGRVVSRSEIMADVWNEPDSETNVADVYVSYLRKKLVPVFGQGVLISVRCKGYILQLPS